MVGETDDDQEGIGHGDQLYHRHHWTIGLRAGFHLAVNRLYPMHGCQDVGFAMVKSWGSFPWRHLGSIAPLCAWYGLSVAARPVTMHIPCQ